MIYEEKKILNVWGTDFLKQFWNEGLQIVKAFVLQNNVYLFYKFGFSYIML